ncbi:MAG: HK97-gp10 family putative phage morphogenesis protein [Eubacteriales bacterium]|nr:HK97-gp10 family putative phage morphogenesis protein [Eubacteriales bacterium]
MDVEVKFDKKGLDELAKALDSDKLHKQAERIIAYHTADLHTRSQRKVPVRTGHLKRSGIAKTDLERLEGRVKYSADYAGYVEKGTRYMDAQPYLEPALNEVKPALVADMKKLNELGG